MMKRKGRETESARKLEDPIRQFLGPRSDEIFLSSSALSWWRLQDHWPPCVRRIYVLLIPARDGNVLPDDAPFSPFQHHKVIVCG
jgi:hypothetical protein